MGSAEGPNPFQRLSPEERAEASLVIKELKKMRHGTDKLCLLPECNNPAVFAYDLVGYCNGIHQAIHAERWRILEKVNDAYLKFEGFDQFGDEGRAEAAQLGVDVFNETVIEIIMYRKQMGTE